MSELELPPHMKLSNFVLGSTGIDVYEACPATAVLRSTRKEKMQFYQWHGIFVHRFLEYCVTRGHDAALEYIRTKKMKNTVAVCERIDPDQLFYGQAEVGYCHDPFEDISRRVPYGLMATRDPETEQYGKADIVVEHGVPRPLVGDYKTGRVKINPTDSTQLLGLAASVRAEGDHEELDIALAEVRQTGEIVWFIQTVDRPVLDRYVDRTRRLHLRVLDDRARAERGIMPDFVRGDAQCTWCNLKPTCPAHTT